MNQEQYDEEVTRTGRHIHVRRKIGKLDEEGLCKMLDDLKYLNEDAVKRWVIRNWPQGKGLFDQPPP